MEAITRKSSHRHGLNRRPKSPIRKFAQRDSYDSETGQAYTETEIVFRKRQNVDWISEYKTPSIISKPHPTTSGSRSLFDLAKTKCVRESRNFTREHYENIPWAVAKQLWAEIVATHFESFWAWQSMASVYNETDEFGQPAYRYHIEIKHPTLSTREYFTGLTTPDCRWLTALRISPRDIPVQDLVAIASIKNLAVLDLSDGQRILENRIANFDERVFRSWAELAISRRAFTHLRVLLLGWQDAVSDWIFKYLHHFPSLCLIVTTDCNGMHQKNRAEWEPTANMHGWEAQHAKKSVKTLRPLLDDSSFYIATVSNCYYESFRQAREGEEEIVHEKADTLPLVECRLGLPRSWTHIIDEFPGTRTVWLEKAMTSQPGTPAGSVQSKRVREVLNASPSSQSPPQKRMQNQSGVRRRATEESATNLLAEFGVF